MREFVNKESGSNLANISDDYLAMEIKFYENYKFKSDETASILKDLLKEQLIRKVKFSCQFFDTNCGNCLSIDAREFIDSDQEIECTKMISNECILDNMKDLEGFV